MIVSHIVRLTPRVTGLKSHPSHHRRDILVAASVLPEFSADSTEPCDADGAEADDDEQSTESRGEQTRAASARKVAATV